MKGSLHTDELMGAVVPIGDGPAHGAAHLHVFVMDVPTYPRLLMVTDAAINIYPTLEDKVDICQNAIDLAHILGIAKPKVAILSAVETINPKIPGDARRRGAVQDGRPRPDRRAASSTARSRSTTRSRSRRRGPRRSTRRSPGEADILLVPDLEAGNMMAKQLQYLAGADCGGHRARHARADRAHVARRQRAHAARVGRGAEARRARRGASRLTARRTERRRRASGARRELLLGERHPVARADRRARRR